ncbi:hypothetical protein ACHWQZ_G006922 [Mnemiopsis leidyi]
MRSNCLAKKKKYLILFITFLTSTFIFYSAIQASELPVQDKSLSGKFLFYNNSTVKQNVGQPSAHFVENFRKVKTVDVKTSGIDNDNDLNPISESEEKRKTERNSKFISETSYQNEEINTDSEPETVSNDHLGQTTTVSPVQKDASVSGESVKEKISVSVDPSSYDDLHTIDWHKLSVEEIDEIYFHNRDAIEKTMKERRANMLSVCTNLRNSVFNRPFLFHFKQLKLSWCPTYKAGSTTWKNYFVNKFIDSEDENPDLSRLWKFRLSTSAGKTTDGRKKYRNEAAKSIRFTVVRNPIVRIISYWKMSRGCGELVRVGMHKDVILTRTLPDQSRRLQFQTELEKYLSWCSEQVAGNKDVVKPKFSEDNPYLNPPHITFPELVNKMERQRAELKSNDWEGHWAPASEWCDVCTHKLDYVAKLENEPWELWFIVDTLGLWDDRVQFLSLKNVASDSGKPSNENEMASFVSQLSGHQIQFLNSFYSNDFAMFNYDRIE